MEARKLQFPEIQMIFSVFELKVSVTKTEIANLLPDERQLFLSLPPIDKNKLDKLKKDFGSVPAEKLLTKVISPFTFSTQNIKKLISIYSPESVVPKASATYIFFNIMTFLFFQSKVLPSDQFTILINGLLRTLNAPSSVGFSSFFFQTMMNLAITFPTMFWDEQLIFTVCEYIENDANLPETFYYTFVQICQIIFSLNNKSFTKCILITINKIYKSKSRCILVSDQTEMMQCLTPFALQPHPLIFEIMPSISLVSQCQAVLDMYINFVSHLYKQFYEEPITIELSETNTSKFILPDVKNPQVNDYCFSDQTHQSFPKGFISLPPEFNESIEIRQKFPSSIWNYLCIISPLLRKSAPQVVDYFIQSLYKFIFSQDDIDDTIFFTVVISIIFLMKENATPTRLKVFKKILVSKKIFNPEETIFQEGGIDPTLNYFRNQVIALLAEKDINIIVNELFDKKYPLQFVEIIGRLLPTNADFSILTKNHQFYSDFMDIAFTFQTIDLSNQSYNKTIHEIRSILFLFLDTTSISLTFRLPHLFSIFCRFLFETEITDQVLLILRKNLFFCKSAENIEVVEEKISLILQKCAKNSDDDRYCQLSIKISEAFVTAMRTYSGVIVLVEKIFSSFILCFKSKPSEKLIFTLLRMIRLISSFYENFSLSTEDTIFLSNFSKQNRVLEKECYIYHLSILSNLRIQKIKENDSYFIFRPQFLLLFLASFGNSPLFDHFLETLSIDCQYSFNTAKRCHEGHLDTIILKFLEKESETATIKYNGIEIEMSISFESQKKYVVPILISIFSAASSTSVLTLLHDLCKKKNQLALLIYQESISICSMNIHPIYLISAMNFETRLNTSSLNSKTFTMNFDQNFSFSFWFKLDFQVISRFQPTITFFKVSNKKIVLSAKYTNSTLVLQSEINGTIATSSILLPIYDLKTTLKKRLLAAKTWHFIGLSFAPDNEYQSAEIFYDGSLKSISPMLLPYFQFSKSSLSIEIGLCNSSDYNNCQEIGYISKFCIFDKALTSKEFLQIYMEDCSFQNNILLFNVPTLLLKSNNIIDLYSTNLALKGFVETFRSNLDFNFLLNLKNIFSYVPFSQRCFVPYMNLLLECINLIENKNYNHYLTVYSIFEAISYEPLQYEWFDKLLVNMNIFTEVDTDSQLLIVSHWSSVLLDNYTKLFTVKSRFSEFFIQIVINFDKFGNLLTQALKFITNIARLNFNAFDTRVLFDIIFGSTKSENLHFYLIVLENVVSVLQKNDQEECLIFLHALINEQIEKKDINEFNKNTLQILSVIHNIGIINSDMEAMALIKQLSSSRDHLLELLKQLCLLETTPSYSSLFFCLLLSIPDIEKIDSEFYSLVFSKSITRFWSTIKLTDDLWFLWPLILTFNISQHDQQLLIFQLMADSTFKLTSSSAIITAMQNICHFSTFISAVSTKETEEENSKTQLYLNCLVNTYLQNHLVNGSVDANFVTELINQILYSIFYHLNWQSHSKILLQEFEKSYFALPFAPYKCTITKRNTSSVDDIIELAHYSSPNYVGHQLLFSKSGQIEGFQLIQSTVPLLQFLKDKHEYLEIIKHFAMNNKTINKGIKLFDKMKKDYSDQFIKTIETIFRCIKSLSHNEKSILQNSSQFDFNKYEELMKKLLVPPKGEDLIKRSSAIEQKVEYIRSCSIGSCGYPSKMKHVKVDQTKLSHNENGIFYYNKNYCINFSGAKYNRFDCAINFLNNKIHSNKINELANGIEDSIMNLTTLNSTSSVFMNTLQSKTETSIPQAFLITIEKKKQISLQITKDELKIVFNATTNDEKIIPFHDIELCYFSGDSKFEIQVINGRSYLFDITPHSNSIISKLIGNSISSNNNNNEIDVMSSNNQQNSNSLNEYNDSNNRHSISSLIATSSLLSPLGKIVQHVNPKSDWISNFDYILLLNRISGRSFINPDLYPVFPQVSGSFDEYKVNLEINSSPSKILNSMQIKMIEVQWGIGPHMPIKICELFSELAVFPEIYYLSELFQVNADLSKKDKSGTVTNFMLPKWSNLSQYEFVYKMRKLLESPLITQCLPKWIDIVWGDRGNTFNQQRKHSVLFTSPHPPKTVVVNKHLNHQLSIQTAKLPPISSSSPSSSSSSDVILASFYENEIGFVMKDRRIIFNRIVIGEKGITLVKARSYSLENSLEDKALFACGSTILTFNKKLFLLTVFYGFKKAVQKTIICGNPMFKAFNESIFAYLADCSTICFFDVDGAGNSRYFMPIEAESNITMFEVNKRFGLVVYATDDNKIVVCSLPSGKVINDYQLDRAPNKILITDCWGFVIIYSEIDHNSNSPSNGYGEIVVLNVNGSFIKKKEFPHKIDYWKAVRSSEKFDYILFQYNSDTLAAFEAMYPEKQHLLCDAKDLIEANYLMNIEAILIMTKNGKILIHPVSLSSLFSEL